MASSGKGPGNNPEECPVCLTGFDDLVQRPRTLPCGHTLCTLCIDKLKQQGHVACPECRVSHAVPEGGQFPVNYTLEAVIRMMRDMKVAAAAASPPPNARKGKGAAGSAVRKGAAAASPPPSAGKGKGAAGSAGRKGAAGLSKKMRSFLQEQEATVVAAITACQEAQSQLDQYEATLTGWCERQQQVEDGLQGLVDQSKSARQLLQQETVRVAAKKEEAKKREQELQAMREALHSATEQEACMAVGEVFRCTSEAEQVLEECRQCFPDVSILTTAKEVREAASAALEAAKALQAALETVSTEQPSSQSDPEEPSSQSHPEETSSQSHPEETSSQSHPEETSSQSHPEETSSQSHPSLKAEDLRSLTQHTRSLLQAGQVIAVHQVRLHARISLEAGRPCLHALTDHPLPLGASTLQVSQVVPPSPPCTVFLDLSWPGRAPRRVHIRLSRDTERGRLFLLLCTGQRGASYRGTRLWDVGWKGEPGECVRGGDYQSNDGEGECVLLPGLEGDEVVWSCRAGEVWGWGGRKGLFAITTRDGQAVYFFQRCVFGEVVKGLHVVAEAAQHSNIREVTVVECGVVL